MPTKYDPAVTAWPGQHHNARVAITWDVLCDYLREIKEASE